MNYDVGGTFEAQFNSDCNAMIAPRCEGEIEENSDRASRIKFRSHP
jgi:hypothetical protein